MMVLKKDVCVLYDYSADGKRVHHRHLEEKIKGQQQGRGN
jgi:hypothetical protein